MKLRLAGVANTLFGLASLTAFFQLTQRFLTVVEMQRGGQYPAARLPDHNELIISTRGRIRRFGVGMTR